MKFPGNAPSFLLLGSGYLLEEKLKLFLRLLQLGTEARARAAA